MDIGAEGKAIARINGIVIFVPYVIPGDIVDIKVVKKRKNYIEALPVQIQTFSPDRIIPPSNILGFAEGANGRCFPIKSN